MGIKDIIKIKEVDSDDIEFLYEMLKERDSRINVTHNELPSFNQHKKFFETNPYDGWYIIMAENNKVGHIHIYDDDTIGWFIKNEYKRFGFVIPAFEKLKKIHPREKYLGKVNPKNIEAQNLLIKLNFVLKETFSDYLLFEYRNKNQ